MSSLLPQTPEDKEPQLVKPANHESALTNLWRAIRTIPPKWVFITVLSIHILFFIAIWMRGIELVSLIALGALGSIASLIACFLAIAIYNRQTEEARSGHEETIKNLQDGLDATIKRLEGLTREMFDEIRKLETPDAIELVNEWFGHDDLDAFEFFSPFSEVPLFWHNNEKALGIIGLFNAQKDPKRITLIGPSQQEFSNLCEAVSNYVANNPPENLPPRIVDWLAEAKPSSPQISNTEEVNLITDTNQQDYQGISNSVELQQPLLNDLTKVIQEEYDALATLLRRVTIRRSSVASKLITGFAFAKFSCSHSRRPGEVYEMLIFSDGSLEDQTTLRTITSDKERVERLLTGPIIYRTKNHIIIHGLRDAVWAILRQETPESHLTTTAELGHSVIS